MLDSSIGAVKVELGTEKARDFIRPRNRKWRKYEDEAMMSIVAYTSQGNGEALQDSNFWD